MTEKIATQMSELEAIMAALPAEKAQELLDFAYYLHQRYTSQPPRGSAAAILQVIEEVGPLQFEEGELETILEDMRHIQSI